SFEQRLELFYLSLAERRTSNMVACIEAMEEIVNLKRREELVQGEGWAGTKAETDVYSEMLQDCRKKAGDVTLDCLRQLCQRRGRADVGEDIGKGGDEEVVAVCYHAVLLGKAESGANIYGGFLRNRLKQGMDSAVKRLSSLRALHRLNLASGAMGVTRDTDSLGDGSKDEDFVKGRGIQAGGDVHPHVTALATVLGEASKLMTVLSETNMGEEVEGPVAQLLHNDCKVQALKVLEWFQHDSDLPKWQAQAVAGPCPGGAGPGIRPGPAYGSGNGGRWDRRAGGGNGEEGGAGGG
ncbi:unnamed protein product, partial [Choristocarpus tenellus]